MAARRTYDRFAPDYNVPMQLRKILCPVDFSDSSRAAMQFAIELAIKTHTPLALVYVWEPPLWATATPGVVFGDALQAVVEDEAKLLEQWADDARRAGVSEVSSSFLEGVAWDRIVDAAQRDTSIDLVVMGTHGRTGLKAALIGSVAEKVVRHAPCRVLVTRERVA